MERSVSVSNIPSIVGFQSPIWLCIAKPSSTSHTCRVNMISFHHLKSRFWSSPFIMNQFIHFNQSILRWLSSTRRHFTCWIFARFAVVTSVLIVRISAALPSRPNSHLRCVSFCVVCWPTLYSSFTAIGLFDPINFVFLKSFFFFHTFFHKK